MNAPCYCSVSPSPSSSPSSSSSSSSSSSLPSLPSPPSSHSLPLTPHYPHYYPRPPPPPLGVHRIRLDNILLRADTLTTFFALMRVIRSKHPEDLRNHQLRHHDYNDLETLSMESLVICNNIDDRLLATNVTYREASLYSAQSIGIA